MRSCPFKTVQDVSSWLYRLELMHFDARLSGQRHGCGVLRNNAAGANRLRRRYIPYRPPIMRAERAPWDVPCPISLPGHREGIEQMKWWHRDEKSGTFELCPSVGPLLRTHRVRGAHRAEGKRVSCICGVYACDPRASKHGCLIKVVLARTVTRSQLFYDRDPARANRASRRQVHETEHSYH